MFVDEKKTSNFFIIHCNNTIILVVDFSFLLMHLSLFFFFLQLEVDFAIGRDITPETVDRVTEVLQDW